MKIELEIAPEMEAELRMIAAELGVSDLTAMAFSALTQWIEARQAELANRDPRQRYFVNEALDELLERQRKPA